MITVREVHGRSLEEEPTAPAGQRNRFRRKPDRTIDICLSCPEKVCKKGECERVRRKKCSTEK